MRYTLSCILEKGQGLVEYALILVVVVVIVIIALTNFGPVVERNFDKVNHSLPGTCYLTSKQLCSTNPDANWVVDCACPGSDSNSCGYSVNSNGAFTCQ
jgi:Flp pilus assembly pilin Flp